VGVNVTTARYYTIEEDDDGYPVNFRYISRSCHCCGNCYPDTLEFQDEDGDWIGQDIEDAGIQTLLRMLIEGSAKFESEDKFDIASQPPMFRTVVGTAE